MVAPTFKVQYTEVERKAVKNLSTSISILKADIRKLAELDAAEGTTAEVIAANAVKVEYKLARIEEKAAKIAEYKSGAGMVECAARKPRIKKEKVVIDHSVEVTPATDDTQLG